jgi:hypothetical protein
MEWLQSQGRRPTWAGPVYKMGQHVSIFELLTCQDVWPKYPNYLNLFFKDTCWIWFGGVSSTYPY